MKRPIAPPLANNDHARPLRQIARLQIAQVETRAHGAAVIITAVPERAVGTAALLPRNEAPDLSAQAITDGQVNRSILRQMIGDCRPLLQGHAIPDRELQVEPVIRVLYACTTPRRCAA